MQISFFRLHRSKSSWHALPGYQYQRIDNQFSRILHKAKAQLLHTSEPLPETYTHSFCCISVALKTSSSAWNFSFVVMIQIHSHFKRWRKLWLTDERSLPFTAAQPAIHRQIDRAKSHNVHVRADYHVRELSYIHSHKSEQIHSQHWLYICCCCSTRCMRFLDRFSTSSVFFFC